jgi:hypothetical protein
MHPARPINAHSDAPAARTRDRNRSPDTAPTTRPPRAGKRIRRLCQLLRVSKHRSTVLPAIFDQIQTRVKYLKFLRFQANAIVLLEQYEFAAVARTPRHSIATMIACLPKLFLISKRGMRRCRTARR